MLSFSDLGLSTTLSGEKKKLEEIINKKIVITGYKVKPSQFNKKGCESYTTIQFYFFDDDNKTPYVVFTGSAVLQEQLVLAFEKLNELNEESFCTTISKTGSFYSLT